MIRRCDEYQAVGEQLVVDEPVLRVGILDAECEIHFIVDESLESFVKQRGAQLNRVLGVPVAEPLEVSGQDERRTGGADRKADGGRDSDGLFKSQPEIAEEIVHSAHQGLGKRVEMLAGGRKRNTRAAAFEQDGRALVLKIPQL